MKHHLSLIITIVASILVCNTIDAQNYTPSPDIIYGQRCYKESDGLYVGHGDKNGTSAIAWPTDNNTQLVYYLHIPAGHTKMYAYITPKSSCAIRLTVTDPESKNIIIETEAGANGNKSTRVEFIPDYNFTSDKWYRFEFRASSGYNTISSLDKLEFYRESDLAITTPAIFMAPSTHLWTTTPVHPSAPSGQSYDWAYEEVMFPAKYEHPARYVEAIGVLKGYMGIQYTATGNRNVIFSMWDNGDTDKDPNLPEYLRSGLMDKDSRVTSERFKGEGTGMKTIFENGQFYKPDKWVQFLFNARPEIIDVTLTGSHGQDSVIKYQNTITTAWYKMEDDPDWTYISTIRASGAANYFNRFYSFLENFGDTGSDFTRAYYRNAYMRSIASGKWYNINHFTFSNTQNTGARNSRSDFGRGVTEIYPNAFYMEHGAFTTAVNDSSQYAGIPLDQSCVDTIDIDSKIKRIDLAIKRNNIEQTQKRMQSTGEKYDLTKWEVIGFSDQEEVAVANNGLAKMAIDGDEKTYWQNKWKNGGVVYPHWIALKAPKPVTISQIDLYSTKSYLYWPKSVVVHTSDDGINWHVATDTAAIVKKAKSTTKLSKRVTSQYFKIEFVEPYGAMLVINEMSLSTDVSVSGIMDYANSLLQNADRFDSYKTEDLVDLKNIYDNGKGTPDQVAETIKDVSTKATPLKYGTIKYNEHISSLRNYQLCNFYGYGKLIVSNNTPSIGESATDNALEIYKAKVNVTLPENNWMLIRCEEQDYIYMYSPALHKYLDLSSESLLSDTPKQVTLRYSYPNYFFTIYSGGKYLSLDPTSADEPVKGVKTLDKSCYFMIYDNFYLTPSQKEAGKHLEQCEDYAKFGTYLAKAKDLLNVKDGMVGCPTVEGRENLQAVYNNGNIGIDSRHELYKAVDSCMRITFNPEKFCYRLKSPSTGNYLTANQGPGIFGKPLDTNDFSQIWSFISKGEGLSLSAQSTVVGRIPNYFGRELPIVVNSNSRNYGTCYVTEQKPGEFIVSTNQYGGIAISSKNLGKTSSYNQTEATFQLETVQSIQVSLNEVGLRAINYNFDIIIPDELKVYVVNQVSNNTAYLYRLYDRLPAGCAAIIKGDANETLQLKISAPTNKVISDNLLTGTYYQEKQVEGNIYMVNDTDSENLTRLNGSIVPENSAYLRVADVASDKIALSFNDEPTMVVDIISQEKTEKLSYDLHGRQVDSGYKGIIIERNRKTLNK